MILHVETFGLFLNFLIAEVSFPYVFFFSDFPGNNLSILTVPSVRIPT